MQDQRQLKPAASGLFLQSNSRTNSIAQGNGSSNGKVTAISPGFESPRELRTAIDESPSSFSVFSRCQMWTKSIFTNRKIAPVRRWPSLLHRWASRTIDNAAYVHHCRKRPTWKSIVSCCSLSIGIFIPLSIYSLAISDFSSRESREGIYHRNENERRASIVFSSLLLISCLASFVFACRLVLQRFTMVQQYQDRLSGRCALPPMELHSQSQASDHSSASQFSFLSANSLTDRFWGTRAVVFRHDPHNINNNGSNSNLNILLEEFDSLSSHQKSTLLHSNFLLNGFVLSTFLLLLFFFLHRASQPHCDANDNDGMMSVKDSLNSWFNIRACLPHSNDSAARSVAADAWAMLLFIGLSASIFRTVRMGLFVFFFVLMFIAVLWAAFGLDAFSGLIQFACWSLVVFLGIQDIRQREIVAFEQQSVLSKMMRDHEMAQKETMANEMRSMIGNVAHDLKTPLASFVTGVDLIYELISTPSTAPVTESQTISTDEAKSDQFAQGDVSRIRGLECPRTTSNSEGNALRLDVRAVRSQSCPSGQCSAEATSSIIECIGNIRNTTAFMLMTINRCIDYTKATKGVALVPRLETCDFQEALKMPLDCMRNVQQRISIALLPLNSRSVRQTSQPIVPMLALKGLGGDKQSEKICTFVITDRQWLQENILCLLSNAVKYSVSGEVTVAVSLVTEDDCLEMESRNKIAVPTASSTRPTPREKTISTILTRGKKGKLSVAPEQITPVPARVDGDDSRETAKVAYKNKEESFKVAWNALENMVVGKPNIKSHDPVSVTIVPRGGGVERQRRGSMTVKAAFSKRFAPKLNPGPASDANAKRPAGHVTVFDDDSTAPQFLLFEVEDRGVGMSDDAMKNLFAPFQQTQRMAGGTGLGLFSLAKRMEALKGFYGVSRRRDGQQGSLFWFAIPYRPDEVAARLWNEVTDGSPHEPRGLSFKRLAPLANPDSMSNLSDSIIGETPVSLEAAGAPAPQLDPLQRAPSIRGSGGPSSNPLARSWNILVVDDVPAIVKMTSMMLRKMGHVVSSAENGLQAVESVTALWKAKREKYDLILMDLQMPVMDGLEAMKRMRSFEDVENALDSHLAEFGHQLIIGLSANSDHETAEAALDAGADVFLPKPFNIDSFNKTLIKVTALK